MPRAAAVIVAIICAIAGSLFFYNQQPQVAEPVTTAVESAVAETTLVAFELDGLDGNKRQFSEWEGKHRIINFWATWCAPCRKEMPDLQKLSEALDQSQFAVIGISVDDDANLVKEFLLRHKIRFINFQDEKLKIASQLLNIQVFPETFIVSPTGTIIKRITGEQTWDENIFKNLLENTHQVETKLTASWAFG